jgi:acetyltransferase
VEAEGVVSRADLGYTFSEIVVRPTLTIARQQERERALALLQKAKTLCLVSRALTTPQKFEVCVNISELSSAGTPSTEFNQRSKFAIRPYPSRYVWQWTMKNHTDIVLRPICPQDESMMVEFHETLSDRTVYFRYFHSVSLKSRVAHERLARICFVDHDGEIVLVADYEDPKTKQHQILGVGRLNKLQDRKEAEVAIVVSDHFQHSGLGTELLRRLVEIARDEKLSRVTCEVLRENVAMQTLAKRLGFTIRMLDDPNSIKAFLEL